MIRKSGLTVAIGGNMEADRMKSRISALGADWQLGQPEGGGRADREGQDSVLQTRRQRCSR